MISSSVALAKADYSYISIVVFLVISKVSINSLFSKIVEESAEAKDSNNEDSNLSKVTEYSFCFFTSSYFYISNSFFSIFTTVASNYSSKPYSVTMKLIMVH